MLAPPNQGSELTDHFKDDAWYRWWMGPAGQQLGTDSASLPRSLGPVEVEVGIIAGRDSFEPWFSRLIPGEDDGKVAVERTKLPEMTDFLVVDSNHPFIMSNPTVMEQVRHFLASGRFRDEPAKAAATGSH